MYKTIFYKCHCCDCELIEVIYTDIQVAAYTSAFSVLFGKYLCQKCSTKVLQNLEHVITEGEFYGAMAIKNDKEPKETLLFDNGSANWEIL